MSGAPEPSARVSGQGVDGATHGPDGAVEGADEMPPVTSQHGVN